MTIKHYDIFFINDKGAIGLNSGDAVLVARDYDFNAEDRRVTTHGVKTHRDLASVAIERAKLTGKIQQVRLVDGPLLGQHIWLIQSTAVDIEQTAKTAAGEVVKVGDRVESLPAGLYRGTVVGVKDDGPVVNWEGGPLSGGCVSIRKIVEPRFKVGDRVFHKGARIYGTVVRPFTRVIGEHRGVDVDWDDSPGRVRGVMESYEDNLEPEPRFKLGDLIRTVKYGTIRRRRDDGLWEMLHDGCGLDRVGSTDVHPLFGEGRPCEDKGVAEDIDSGHTVLLPRA